MHKTLVGKNGYLFLTNDTCNSIQKHTILNENMNDNNLKRVYDKYKKDIVFLVFPDKEILCKKYLPDNISCEYRNELQVYKKYFGSKLIDPIEVLDYTDYYKTDTHINNKGALKVFNLFLETLQNNFSISFIFDNYYEEINVKSLNEIGRGIGDMTWERNLGNIKLDNTEDIYYKINCDGFVYHIYNNSMNDPYKILNYDLTDITDNIYDKQIGWNIISENILFKKNEKYKIKKKVILFYDSFLAQTVNLYKNIFEEIYLIKSFHDEKIINKIKPDLIYVFCIERFLFTLIG
jgi:hypothetical protein